MPKRPTPDRPDFELLEVRLFGIPIFQRRLSGPGDAQKIAAAIEPVVKELRELAATVEAVTKTIATLVELMDKVTKRG